MQQGIFLMPKWDTASTASYAAPSIYLWTFRITTNIVEQVHVSVREVLQYLRNMVSTGEGMTGRIKFEKNFVLHSELSDGRFKNFR